MVSPDWRLRWRAGPTARSGQRRLGFCASPNSLASLRYSPTVLLDVGIELRSGHAERIQAALVAQRLELLRGHHLGEGVQPDLVIGVGDLRRRGRSRGRSATRCRSPLPSPSGCPPHRLAGACRRTRPACGSAPPCAAAGRRRRRRCRPGCGRPAAPSSPRRCPRRRRSASTSGRRRPACDSVATFVQSWLPTVPPPPIATLVGSALIAAIRSFSVLYGESARTEMQP